MKLKKLLKSCNNKILKKTRIHYPNCQFVIRKKLYLRMMLKRFLGKKMEEEERMRVSQIKKNDKQ